MSLVKKSEIKNYLSPLFRTEIHLCLPASQPEATGCSATRPDAIKANSSNFAEDFFREHTSSIAAVTAANLVTGSIHRQSPTVSKSAQE